MHALTLFQSPKNVTNISHNHSCEFVRAQVKLDVDPVVDREMEPLLCQAQLLIPLPIIFSRFELGSEFLAKLHHKNRLACE